MTTVPHPPGAPHPDNQVTSSRGLSDLEAAYGNDRKFIWAVARTLQLLQAFRPGHGAMGNNELSERTGIAKATVTRITYTLTELGYLNRTASRKYFPTPMLLSLAHSVLGNLRLRQMAQGGMQELANLSGASVALAWPEADTMIYVAANSASTSNSLLLDIGTRVAMAKSACGRAYLSSLDADQLETVFERWSVLYADDWPALKERILGSIHDIRTKGFCIVDGEWRSNVRAVAVPIHDREHGTTLALNCGGPSFDLPLEQLETEFGPRLLHLARTLAGLS